MMVIRQPGIMSTSSRSLYLVRGWKAPLINWTVERIKWMNEWDGSFAPFLDSYYIITYYYHYHYDDDDGLNGNEWVSEWDQIRGAHPTNLCRRPVSTTVGIIILHLGIMSSTRWCVSRVVLALARDNYKDVVVVFSYSSAVDLSENGFLSWCCWDDTTCFCSILQPPLHCPLLSHRCYCFMKSHPSIPHPPIRAGIIIFMLHLPLYGYAALWFLFSNVASDGGGD